MEEIEARLGTYGGVWYCSTREVAMYFYGEALPGPRKIET